MAPPWRLARAAGSVRCCWPAHSSRAPSPSTPSGRCKTLRRAQDRTHFLKNVSLLGGVLLAAQDTEGKPSLTWRAQKGGQTLAKDARKASKKLAKSTSRAAGSAGDLADTAVASGAALVEAVAESSRRVRKQAARQLKEAKALAAKQAEEAQEAAAKAAKKAKKEARKQAKVVAKKAKKIGENVQLGENDSPTCQGLATDADKSVVGDGVPRI